MSSIDSAQGSAGNVGPADDRPLSPQEYQLLQRLLSDPLSIPIQFKTWLVSYLETSDMNLPLSAVQGLTGILGINTNGSLGIFPAGIILPYGGVTAPDGALLCDGASYSRAGFARLFAVIGTEFGSVDANSFNVPDIQDRVPVGKGTQAVTNTVGKTEGLPLGQRSIEHRHPISTQEIGQQPGGTAYVMWPTDEPDVLGSTTEPHLSPNVNRPAFVTLNFIIVA